MSANVTDKGLKYYKCSTNPDYYCDYFKEKLEIEYVMIWSNSKQLSSKECVKIS